MTSRIVICDPNPVRSARLSAPLAADGLRVRCEAALPSDVGTQAHCDVLLLCSELCSPAQLQQARLLSAMDAQIVVVIASNGTDEATQYVDAGAHDVLLPPYLAGHVVGRVRAASQRAAIDLSDGPVQCATVNIDLKRREIRRKGRLVAFTANEFCVLQALVQRAGHITTTRMLRRALWGDDAGGTLKSLTAYIRAVRAKLEQDPDHPFILTTESGIGYRWMGVEPTGSET